MSFKNKLESFSGNFTCIFYSKLIISFLSFNLSRLSSPSSPQLQDNVTLILSKLLFSKRLVTFLVMEVSDLLTTKRMAPNSRKRLTPRVTVVVNTATLEMTARPSLFSTPLERTDSKFLVIIFQKLPFHKPQLHNMLHNLNTMPSPNNKLPTTRETTMRMVNTVQTCTRLHTNTTTTSTPKTTQANKPHKILSPTTTMLFQLNNNLNNSNNTPPPPPHLQTVFSLQASLTSTELQMVSNIPSTLTKFLEN